MQPFSLLASPLPDVRAILGRDSKDVVEFGGDDQAAEQRRALAAAIGAGEEPALAPKGNASQGAFRRIVKGIVFSRPGSVAASDPFG